MPTQGLLYKHGRKETGHLLRAVDGPPTAASVVTSGSN